MTQAQRRILSALVSAGGAAGVSDIAASVGVHVTTARFHLERMVADGIVAVRPEPVDGAQPRGRGRPRVQYVALTLPDAGDAETSGLHPTPAVRAVFDVSQALGFEPRLSPAGHPNEFHLTACPYRSGGDPVPVDVCRAHEALLQQAADLTVAGSAQTGVVARVQLLPLVTTQTCHLRVS